MLGKWLAEQVINEDSNIKHVIMIYPGRFQPMGKHHAEVYKQLAEKFGKTKTYIATSDIVKLPKSPLNFNEKSMVMSKLGITNVVQVKNPYQSTEITSKYDPETTAVLFAVGKKDMMEDPRFRVGLKKNGEPSYFQYYDKNKNNLQPYTKHGYLYVAPHVSLNVPGFGEMSGTVLRQSLATADEKTFKDIMGFFDPKIYNMMRGKFSQLATESILTEQPIPPDLLSSFNIQSNLNPVIWTKDGKLDPVVHKKLLKIAVNFFKELGLPIGVKIQDIRFTGSLANYNWSKFSDIDLHIVLNFGDISTDAEFVHNYFIAKKNLWNQKHDIIIRGYPVEVYVENVDEPHTATGLYSVLTNSWIKVPSHASVQIDKNAIKVKAKSFIDMASELENMIGRGEYEDVMSMVEEIKTKLKNMRRAGLEGAGEYSIENLAFKVLRRNGFIERINLIADKAYDLDLGEGYNKNLIESRLLTEGGASGHMNHPFDDRDLTFAEMKQIVRLALQGQLDIEEAVTEKTDGQNLNVTFKNGKVGAARNKATIKNPMTVDQVKAQFEGRGDIADAFGFAMQDLEKAITAIPDVKREEIFQNGTRFVNLEIIYPATKNVINYGSDAYLQFHGLNEFDLESGDKIAEYPEYGNMLQKMISDVNADTQEHFKIIPPNVIKMQKTRDFDSREKYFIDEISKLQREFGLTDDDEVIMYHQRWWERFIDAQFPGITPDVKEGLIRRWAYDDKSFRLNNKTIADDTVLQKAIEFDKKNFAAQNKKNVYPFERIFLELGAEVLKNVTNYLATNTDAAVTQLRKDIATTIKQLKASDDIQALQKLQHELKRVESMGGFKKLVPSEGIVFVYKGKTYKLTGLFAPINQLLGISRYAR